MSGMERDLALGRPAGGGAVPVGTDNIARRETRVIYIGLAVAAVFALMMVFFLTRGASTPTTGVVSDTRYDFAYRDPNTIISNTDRIVIDADVSIKLTPHKDRPDSIHIETTDTAAGSNGSFTWVITPQLGAGGPTQLAGEFYFQGTLYRACEAIIGSPTNFPPPLNRLYAEQYHPIGNVGLRYRVPEQVDQAPFVAFMRTTIADTALFRGDGSLPSRQIREMAGSLIQNCTAQ